MSGFARILILMLSAYVIPLTAFSFWTTGALGAILGMGIAGISGLFFFDYYSRHQTYAIDSWDIRPERWKHRLDEYVKEVKKKR